MDSGQKKESSFLIFRLPFEEFRTGAAFRYRITLGGRYFFGEFQVDVLETLTAIHKEQEECEAESGCGDGQGSGEAMDNDEALNEDADEDEDFEEEDDNWDIFIPKPVLSWQPGSMATVAAWPLGDGNFKLLWLRSDCGSVVIGQPDQSIRNDFGLELFASFLAAEKGELPSGRYDAVPMAAALPAPLSEGQALNGLAGWEFFSGTPAVLNQWPWTITGRGCFLIVDLLELILPDGRRVPLSYAERNDQDPLRRTKGRNVFLTGEDHITLVWQRDCPAHFVLRNDVDGSVYIGRHRMLGWHDVLRPYRKWFWLPLLFLVVLWWVELVEGVRVAPYLTVFILAIAAIPFVTVGCNKLTAAWKNIRKAMRNFGVRGEPDNPEPPGNHLTAVSRFGNPLPTDLDTLFGEYWEGEKNKA